MIVQLHINFRGRTLQGRLHRRSRIRKLAGYFARRESGNPFSRRTAGRAVKHRRAHAKAGNVDEEARLSLVRTIHESYSPRVDHSRPAIAQPARRGSDVRRQTDRAPKVTAGT